MVPSNLALLFVLGEKKPSYVVVKMAAMKLEAGSYSGKKPALTTRLGIGFCFLEVSCMTLSIVGLKWDDCYTWLRPARM